MQRTTMVLGAALFVTALASGCGLCGACRCDSCSSGYESHASPVYHTPQSGIYYDSSTPIQSSPLPTPVPQNGYSNGVPGNGNYNNSNGSPAINNYAPSSVPQSYQGNRYEGSDIR